MVSIPAVFTHSVSDRGALFWTWLWREAKASVRSQMNFSPKSNAPKYTVKKEAGIQRRLKSF